ncbi:hypothetical protein B6U79_01365 [Candidatus Bathyarchaeota archaeon ex4484_231]|nr:MAG: hypothetical protein B6U79_01365 [Candidatus Bathyarchaeota archaeon ex4484_231]
MPLLKSLYARKPPGYFEVLVEVKKPNVIWVKDSPGSRRKNGGLPVVLRCEMRERKRLPSRLCT